MGSKPLGMSASFLFSLYEKLDSDKVDVVQLLSIAGIERERLTRPGAMLSVREVEAFMAAAKQLTGRGDLAFDVGRGIKLNSHDLLGVAMMSCNNVDQAIRMASRHYHLMTTVFTLRYRRLGQIGEAIYTPTMALPPETLHFYLEVIAVAQQNQMMLTIGERVTGYDIYLSMPAPAHQARYFGLAPARFHFDERATPGVRVVMDGNLLDTPFPLASSLLRQQVEERLEATQRMQTPEDGQWGELLAMMLRETKGSQLTLEAIAQRLQVSPRTIERALGTEGLKFRDLSQKIMFEQACELLDASGATVSQVAEALGFGEISSFSRAFRRVAGLSPSEYMAASPATRRALRLKA